jgi:hypothetical protein
VDDRQLLLADIVLVLLVRERGCSYFHYGSDQVIEDLDSGGLLHVERIEYVLGDVDWRVLPVFGVQYPYPNLDVD